MQINFERIDTMLIQTVGQRFDEIWFQGFID